MTARSAAIIIGIVFVLFGLLGFINNPILGMFDTNAVANLIYIVAGIVLLAGAYSSLGSGMALKIIGVIYALIAIVGFFGVTDGMWLGLFPDPSADQWLYVVLAVILLIAGFAMADEEHAMAM